jgi:hypothetical protein
MGPLIGKPGKPVFSLSFSMQFDSEKPLAASAGNCNFEEHLDARDRTRSFGTRDRGDCRNRLWLVLRINGRAPRSQGTIFPVVLEWKLH